MPRSSRPAIVPSRGCVLCTGASECAARKQFDKRLLFPCVCDSQVVCVYSASLRVLWPRCASAKQQSQGDRQRRRASDVLTFMSKSGTSLPPPNGAADALQDKPVRLLAVHAPEANIIHSVSVTLPRPKVHSPCQHSPSRAQDVTPQQSLCCC